MAKSTSSEKRPRKSKTDDLFMRADKLADEGDFKSAFRLFLAAAKAGDSSCQINLGNFYDDGKGVRRNRSAAMYKRVVLPELRLATESQRRYHNESREKDKNENHRGRHANHAKPMVVRRTPRISSKQCNHDGGNDIESNSQARRVVCSQCPDVVALRVTERKIDWLTHGTRSTLPSYCLCPST